MLQQSLSPLMQVMQTPLAVISHLQVPIVKQQQQTIMPFIMQQQLHMVPAMVLHRFCSMLTAILSSQVHMIFMPPVHFSILIVQRGTMVMFMPDCGIDIPMLGMFMPGIVLPLEVIIGLIMDPSPWFDRPDPLPPPAMAERFVDQFMGMIPCEPDHAMTTEIL